jgi:DNA-binding transcriptional ArsR family regulator
LTLALHFYKSGNLELTVAVERLGALAQKSRLEVFRLLVRAGDNGMPAGDIARALDVPANTMSAHLAILADAGLVTSRRDGRSIVYRVDFDGMRGLLAYLMEDCCRGRPEVCAPLAAVAAKAAACCPTPTKRKPS